MLCLHDSIRHDDPAVQRLLRAVEDAPSLTAVILAAWQVARVLTVHLVEAVLAERARCPSAWPRCPQCGVFLRSKGLATRQGTSLFGPIRWRRRGGRCPHGCAIPQVAPWDEALGVQPPQRTSGELQPLGCAVAVFMPFATAARLLGWYSGGSVSPQAGWGGCQRLVTERWRPSRSTCPRWRKAPCLRRRRWRLTSQPLPWSWAPMG